MRLYLARHGKAEFGPEDADRHLSARGRADVEAMADHLAHQHIVVNEVFHSTLARARQTAEILATKMAREPVLNELEGIEPWGDVKAFVKLANTWEHDTLVCGHEPFMGEVASFLMTGDAHSDVLDVKTGTVMAFERTPYGAQWRMRWMLTPRIVRGPKVLEDDT